MISPALGKSPLYYNNDILYSLFDTLPDILLLNLSLTCQYIFALAEPVLRHRKLETTFSSIHFDHSVASRVIDYLRTSPDSARRVKHIALYTEQTCSPPLLIKALKWRKWERILTDIHHLIDDQAFLQFHEKVMWKNRVTAQSNMSYIVVLLLLTLCPNLNHIAFSGNLHSFWTRLWPYLEPDTRQQRRLAITRNQIHCLTLNETRPLHAHNKPNPLTLTFNTFTEIASLPNLQHLKLDHVLVEPFDSLQPLESHSPHPTTTTTTTTTPTLTHLHLSYTAVTPETLAQIITHIPALHSLKASNSSSLIALELALNYHHHHHYHHLLHPPNPQLSQPHNQPHNTDPDPDTDTDPETRTFLTLFRSIAHDTLHERKLAIRSWSRRSDGYSVFYVEKQTPPTIPTAGVVA